jgi:hypothetical protein
MTIPSRGEVLEHLLQTLHSMRDEWADEVHLTEDSLIMGNQNWRSIEIVYVANVLQTHYRRIFPFEALMQQIEQRERKDVSVREWVDFVVTHFPTAPVLHEADPEHDADSAPSQPTAPG